MERASSSESTDSDCSELSEWSDYTESEITAGDKCFGVLILLCSFLLGTTGGVFGYKMIPGSKQPDPTNLLDLSTFPQLTLIKTGYTESYGLATTKEDFWEVKFKEMIVGKDKFKEETKKDMGRNETTGYEYALSMLEEITPEKAEEDFDISKDRRFKIWTAKPMRKKLGNDNAEEEDVTPEERGKPENHYSNPYWLEFGENYFYPINLPQKDLPSEYLNI